MKESLLQKRKKKGFTLIELIVVIAIIAIIALIAIPKVMGYQDDAKKKADIANAKTISNTTAAEVTKGDITLGSTALTFKVATGTKPTDVKDDANKIKMAQFQVGDALQTIPQMQYSTNNGNPYYVSISTDGTVTVYDADPSGTSNQVYPKPDTVGSNIYYK